jgi:THO complex subunit 1
VNYFQLTIQLILGKFNQSRKYLHIIVIKHIYCREADKKAVWDQAFRDRFLSDSSNFSIPLFEKLLQLSLDCAVALVCSPTLPVILLTDAFDILSLEKCEEIFYMVEMKVAIWKQELFFNQCKNTLLRLCNGM